MEKHCDRGGMERRPRAFVPIVVLMVVVALVSSGVTAFVCRTRLFDGAMPLVEMSDLIESAYYYYDAEKNDEAVLTDAALRGMLSSIHDDYARYYNAEEYAEHLRSGSGEYKGIGAIVEAPTEQGSRIQRIYDGSPMDLAGAHTGDIILSINGNAVAGLPLDEMLAFLYDDAENEIVLSRGDETLTVFVMKAVVNVPYTAYALLEDGIGYLRIDEFNGRVVQESQDALTALRDGGAERLILDLRDNPGGNLDAVLGVADLFLNREQLIVSIRSRIEETENYYAKDDPMWDAPTVLLINGGSASASELLAGALQDHGRAEVVGTRSFGKGIVQTYFRLPANGGYVKLTTDAYYTPNNVCIHGIGITPDVVVELPEEYRDADANLVPRERDTQLLTAIDMLKGE